MEVKLSQAVKMFFGNSSLEMVFFEAVANSLDAEATEINIDICARAYNQSETLTIKVSDNGVGFTDERYRKFSKLFDVDESSHKGLGRLVYLCYFDSIKISSYYEKTHYREFEFNENFDPKKAITAEIEPTRSGTTILMSGYNKSKVWKHEFVQPKYLINRISEEFHTKLFQLKNQNKDFVVNISSTIDEAVRKYAVTKDDIPEFNLIELEDSVNLIDKFQLYYSIEKVDFSETSLLAAISVDNRTKKIDLVDRENIITEYKMVFLLYSDWFKGKIDFSRQNLTVSDSEKPSMQTIQAMFRKKIAGIIEESIPKVKKRNMETKKSIINKYPHLSTYLDSDNIGYLSINEILKRAQEQFFKDQRELLDANSLTPEQYQKSLDVSSKALTEYILFRQKIIENLKETNNKNSEADIHNLFVKMKQLFIKDNSSEDLYRNNAWLLDDKYMTYDTVLSDRDLDEVIRYITDEETEKDSNRPDIALIFSNNLQNEHFDVVIIELKKRGISLEENMKVVTQLEKRARKLMKYYNNKIQRIWFYGIIEFNEETELSLTGEYKELFSSGKMYYREMPVAIQKNPTIILPVGVFVLDLDSIISDADSKNSVFINLIR
jgi:hypothetical protein